MIETIKVPICDKCGLVGGGNGVESICPECGTSMEFTEFVRQPTKRAGGRLKLVRVYEEFEVEEVSVGEYRLKNRRR